MPARIQVMAGVLLLSLPALGGTIAAPPQPADTQPRVLYQALNDLRVDGARVYYVHELNLRRETVSLTLVEGKLAFLAPLHGRITGAVFVGRGHAIALPRDPAERLSLAEFLGVPLLDLGFSRAYFRFTDDSATELAKQLERAGATPTEEPAYAESWNQTLLNLNPWHSRRILRDWLSTNPRPYFYAGLVGDSTGPLDVLIDHRKDEPVFIGQPRTVNGERFYDVWASYAPDSISKPPEEIFAPIDYTIDTTISDSLTLSGKTLLRMKVMQPGERVVILELSRYLAVDSCTDANGASLTFFQNEDLSRRELARRGNDELLVVLPTAPVAGQELRLQLTYRGNVISDAGNGAYFVGDRGSWYPHLGGQDRFVPFDLTFRWPRRLTLVATGDPVESQEENGQHIGHWRSGQPLAIAGFNLGDYESKSVGSDRPSIRVYANRQLEEAIMARLRSSPEELSEAPGPPPVPPRLRQVIPEAVPPSPASVLGHLGDDILDSIRFFEKKNGPFPFDHLDVSQIPGSFGQGWPGLLYLPTIVFLPSDTQHQIGFGLHAQKLSQVIPFHEVAHQWWGNQVGIASYRDAWIHEAMANYLALWYADSKRPFEHLLSKQLDSYRSELLAPATPGGESVDHAGPLTMGYRLESSKSPDAYEKIIYGKGCWVIHMLRMLMREPAAKDPDARFVQFLHSVLTEHRFEALSNSDFQSAAEKFMTPAMDLEGSGSLDWFFDDWVRGTGIPRFAVQFQARPNGSEFAVTGKLKQAGVMDSFITPVPLYAAPAGGKPVLLGVVITNGPETNFHFNSRVRPARILVDPTFTLLHRTD